MNGEMIKDILTEEQKKEVKKSIDITSALICVSCVVALPIYSPFVISSTLKNRKKVLKQYGI